MHHSCSYLCFYAQRIIFSPSYDLELDIGGYIKTRDVTISRLFALASLRATIENLSSFQYHCLPHSYPLGASFNSTYWTLSSFFLVMLPSSFLSITQICWECRSDTTGMKSLHDTSHSSATPLGSCPRERHHLPPRRL